ncbi:hypothetical protein PMAYCL1PPCAC_03149, partial [Pristionchus mayeri]
SRLNISVHGAHIVPDVSQEKLWELVCSTVADSLFPDLLFTYQNLEAFIYNCRLEVHADADKPFYGFERHSDEFVAAVNKETVTTFAAFEARKNEALKKLPWGIRYEVDKPLPSL